MVLAEVHFDAHVLHLVAGDHAAVDPFLEALFDGRHEVAGDHAADDRVDPEEVVLLVVVVLLQLREVRLGGKLLDVGAARQREHADVHFAELAAAAGLLLVAVAALGVGLDRFAVGDLRLLGFDFHLVAALEPLADDRQVQLAHAGHHQFLGLRIAVEAERRIFLDDLVQRTGELGLVAAALGRDGQADHRRGELNRRQPHFAQQAARLQLFHLGDGHDVARPGLVDVLVSPPCTSSKWPILTPLRALDAGTRSSLLSVPEKTRMKLSFCTNGSMRVLKTWATSGPPGSA